MVLASIFALIAYVLALTRVWWGPPLDDTPPAVKEPWLLKFAIVGLVVLLVVGGVWPGLVGQWMGVAR